MKLKILNKNLTVENDYSSAEIFNIDDGFTLTETKNETLDSATLVISNMTKKIEMEPYDLVYLLNDNGTRRKTMCIDTYTETMICVKPTIYRYEISLFSETKQLEGIVLPNLKITSLKDAQTQRSVSYYIDQYFDEYCPKKRKALSPEGYSWVKKWEMIDSFPNKFYNTECPEMQWNTPTLREVLNDLMMVCDCIPILKNGILSYMDLTESPTTNPDELEDVSEDSHINYVTSSKSSEDYVSELQVKLENVTNKSKEVNNLVTHTEYFPFECSDNNATLMSNNILAKTRYPIYNLKSVKIMFPSRYVYDEQTPSQKKYEWIEADLMNLTDDSSDTPFSLIYEYEEWLTKKILYSDITLSSNNMRGWTEYQNWTLYYQRGGNEITGWNNSSRFWFVTYFWLEQLQQGLTVAQANSHSFVHLHSAVAPLTAVKYFNFLFKIEYETLEGCVFRASKGEHAINDRVIIDNQTNSYVDSYSQGFLEYQKANRLGNEQLQINARYPIEYDGHQIQIGDSYQDTIIYQCEYQFFKDHIEVNALATKNYILREYFTGVKSKIRSWAIASGSQALTRHDLIKYYCEFSYNQHCELYGLDEINNNSNYNISEYLLSPFTEYEANPLDVAFVRTYTITYLPGPQPENYNYYPPFNPNTAEASHYSIDLMSRVVGNSLVFTFEMLDNYSAGKSFNTVEDEEYSNIEIAKTDIEVQSEILSLNSQSIVRLISGEEITQGIPLHQYPYTNNKGEFDGGEIILSDGLTLGNVKSGDEWYDGSNLNSDSVDFLYGAYQLPRVYSSNTSGHEIINIPFKYKKDSQEITNISAQFEFCSDTTDIAVGKEFILQQQAVSVTDNDSQYLRWAMKIYPKNKYDFRRPDVLPEWTLNGYDLKINIVNNANCKTQSWLQFSFDTNRTTYDEVEAIKKELKNKCFYIYKYEYADYPHSVDDVKVLLALNNIKSFYDYFDTTSGHYFLEFSVSLNILKTRNKYIYGEDGVTIEDELV